MSNLTPFGDGETNPAVPQSSKTDVFRPDLKDFDFAAYEERQAQLNALLLEGGASVSELLQRLHQKDPGVGVMLNNLHDTIIEGDIPAGLNASLGVMTRSIIQASIPGFIFMGGVAPEVDFSDQNVRGGDFKNSILTRANFSNTNLFGADFTNAVVNGANFANANLAGTDFTGAYLVNVEGLTEEQVLGMKLRAARTTIQASSEPTSLEQILSSRFGEAESLKDILKFIDPVPAVINKSTGQPIGRLQAKKVLRGLHATNQNWTQADFISSNLTGATIEGLTADQASLREVAIGGAVIQRAVMREIDMFATWAPGIILEEVNLRGANVTKANLVGAILRGVDLREVVGLSDKDTNLEGMVIEDCILPAGYGYNGIKLEASQKLQRELES